MLGQVATNGDIFGLIFLDSIRRKHMRFFQCAVNIVLVTCHRRRRCRLRRRRRRLLVLCGFIFSFRF
jgi:hypothetical protein